MLLYLEKCFTDSSISKSKNVLHETAYKLLDNALLNKYNLKKPVNGYSLTYNEKGKPYLEGASDIFFNISHCRKMAVCALSKYEIGVDIENIRKYPEKVLSRCFSDNEICAIKDSKNQDKMFFRLWTLKESYVKAIGIGISYPLKSIEFNICDNIITAKGCDGYSFRQFNINNEFICSVCIKGLCENREEYINKTFDYMELEFN